MFGTYSRLDPVFINVVIRKLNKLKACQEYYKLELEKSNLEVEECQIWLEELLTTNPTTIWFLGAKASGQFKPKFK